MKQIKTIIRLDKRVEEFDADVNKALAEGWTLTKRDVLLACETSQLIHNRCLYAELEREVITEAERICDNCLHADKAPEDEPCLHCSEDCDKWEEYKA